MGLASLPRYVAAALERVSTALSVVCGLCPRSRPLRKKCFAFDGLPGQARRWRQTHWVGKNRRAGGECPTSAHDFAHHVGARTMPCGKIRRLSYSSLATRGFGGSPDAMVSPGPHVAIAQVRWLLGGAFVLVLEARQPLLPIGRHRGVFRPREVEPVEAGRVYAEEKLLDPPIVAAQRRGTALFFSFFWGFAP